MALAPADLRPMLASLRDAPLADPDLVYEPKYDGIRAIAEVGPTGAVRLWSRLGNEKTAQFPEIAAALAHWARGLGAPVVLDGEIVALDGRGEPTGFQQLQGRIHLADGKRGRESFPRKANVGRNAGDSGQNLEISGEKRGRESFKRGRESFPTAFIAFDVLRDGRTDLRDRPLTERRAALERIFGRTRSPILRISESVRGDGMPLYKRALASGWEGLIAKHADSRYKSGKRTPDWRKLKIVHEQEFVIGGWTEPRQTRSSFGALLLGVYDRKSLVYIGHSGTGFNEAELAHVMKLLKPLETTQCPFRERPKTNERPHWVQPTLVAQIKFTEWTADGKLRHPVYLGLRDDKQPDDVRRERVLRLHAVSEGRLAGLKPRAASANQRRTEVRLKPDATSDTGNLIEQLNALEASRRNGIVVLPDGDSLAVTNLHKVFWPKQKLTKGDLLRYYAQVAPLSLPAVRDRPLVLKRFPNGITGQPFYQHRAPDAVPPGVRIEHVRGEKTVPTRFIGGNLTTLLYMTQIATISQDPWFSRVESPEIADYVALDLDPAPGVSFARVRDVARWIRDELASIGATGVPKTSGADGLHVYIPLPPDTPYEAGRLFCQIIATVVAQKHPKMATVERSVQARGARVYVDCLQNILGKTLATAYSARASSWAGVSTPLTWREVDEGVRREDFTIDTMPERIRQVGDLWKALRASKGIDLAQVSQYAQHAQQGLRRP